MNMPSLVFLVTASMLVWSPSRPATCFHFHRGRSDLLRGLSRRHSHGAAPTTATDPTGGGDGGAAREWEWDERLRREATDALLPVLFPESRDPSSGTRGPVAAEVALKRLLRERYQRPPRGGDSDRPPRGRDAEEETADAARGRLAALVLGTGVMRLRHFHDALVGEHWLQTKSANDIPIPYPLDSSVLCSWMRGNDTDDGDGANGLEPLVSDDRGHSIDERSLVRAMVDGHARYLSTSDRTPTLQSNYRNDPTIDLSLRYSLPPFLASSLLSHYGHETTEHICSVMNSRGPITIRKNAIRFPGSSEELCERLRKEDGVTAEPLATLLGGIGPPLAWPRRTIGLVAPSNGSRRYIMGSLTGSGSIGPPEGSIRILPQQSKSIWSMTGWQNGYFEVQDAGSQLIVQSLEVEPGESILDYCAGNGGKTFALASAVMNSESAAGNSTNCVLHSHIVAHDVVEERLRQIKGSLSRVGLVARRDDSNCNGTITAQTSLPNRKCTLQTSSNLDATHGSSRFDAVLVDAPCSSTGVLRRRPSQRWDLTEKQISEELPRLQSDLLERAAAFVCAKGGRLVYSTCSLLPEENESVAREFEASRAFLDLGFKRWEFDSSGIDDGAERDIDGGGKGKDCHMLTILPSETGSDGFFIARWKRHRRTA